MTESGPTTELRDHLRALIASGADLLQLREALVQFAARGGTSAEAERAFRNLHLEFTDEAKEDLLLELLDLVTGWCAPHLRVW